MTIGIVMTIYIVINSTSFWGCTGFDRSVEDGEAIRGTCDHVKTWETIKR